MSKESLAKFWKKIETDPKLRREFEALFKTTGGRTVATGTVIVALAAKHGFQFTADELKKHLAATGGEAELSEAELEAVAGGYEEIAFTFSKLRGWKTTDGKERDGMIMF